MTPATPYAPSAPARRASAAAAAAASAAALRRMMASATAPAAAAAASPAAVRPAPPPPPSPATAAAARHVHVVDPRAEFRDRMRALRRAYQDETQDLREARRVAAAEERRRRADAATARRRDIEAFRRARAMSFDDGVAAQPSADTDAALGVDQGEGDAVAGTTASAETATTTAPSEQSWIADFVAARRRTRFETELRRQGDQARVRQEALLYLFHAAEDFVTYENLEEKLKVFHDSYFATHARHRSHASVETLARRRLMDQGRISPTAATLAAPGRVVPADDQVGEPAGQFPDGPSAVRPRRDFEAGARRYEALQDVVAGTLAGRPGLDAVLGLADEIRAAGGDAALRRRRDERLARYDEDRDRVLRDREGGPAVGNGGGKAQKNAAASGGDQRKPSRDASVDGFLDIVDSFSKPDKDK
ncbi:hypothetical protein HK405_006153 [Cladochytrium tenue]|nr:hypothetical protein HK405_006153 [Cladochytrium tenue]